LVINFGNFSTTAQQHAAPHRHVPHAHWYCAQIPKQHAGSIFACPLCASVSFARQTSAGQRTPAHTQDTFLYITSPQHQLATPSNRLSTGPVCPDKALRWLQIENEAAARLCSPDQDSHPPSRVTGAEATRAV
jgi:hypothetical protein